MIFQEVSKILYYYYLFSMIVEANIANISFLSFIFVEKISVLTIF